MRNRQPGKGFWQEYRGDRSHLPVAGPSVRLAVISVHEPAYERSLELSDASVGFAGDAARMTIPGCVSPLT